MTLNEAIKELIAYSNEEEVILVKDFDDAVNLGIKALERLEWLRSRQVIFCDKLLEGETEK